MMRAGFGRLSSTLAKPPTAAEHPILVRTALVLLTLHVALAQTVPPHLSFLYKQLAPFRAAEKFKPQTGKQKLHAYLINMAGPVTLFTEAGAAGLSQAIGSPWQWGDGAAAYARRYGNHLAYNGVRQSLAYASSLLLHEDDRYFASEQRGAWPRIRHAIASVFIARKPGGRTVFATSSLVGIAGASLVSRAWSPESWQTPSGTARSMAISVTGAAGFNIVREFLPDLMHRSRPCSSSQP